MLTNLLRVRAALPAILSGSYALMASAGSAAQVPQHNAAAARANPPFDWSLDNIEVWKLIASFLTPLAVVIIGYILSRQIEHLKLRHFASQKLIEIRLKVFEDVAPLLNDIMGYIREIASWKNMTPPEIIGLKRKVDRSIAVNAALFSKEFVSSYRKFMDTCFQHYSGEGKSAGIRADLAAHRKHYAGNWQPEWDAYFSPPADKVAVATVYDELMAEFGKEVGAPGASARDIAFSEENQIPDGSFIPPNVRMIEIGTHVFWTTGTRADLEDIKSGNYVMVTSDPNSSKGEIRGRIELVEKERSGQYEPVLLYHVRSIDNPDQLRIYDFYDREDFVERLHQYTPTG